MVLKNAIFKYFYFCAVFQGTFANKKPFNETYIKAEIKEYLNKNKNASAYALYENFPFLSFDAETEMWFMLYTRTQNFKFYPKNISAILQSSFNKNHSTRIVIHGWTGSAQVESVQSIKDAYLKKGDHNVILVDWSAGADNLWYPTAAARVYDAAKVVAKLVDFLFVKNLLITDLHVIGFSLGGQVAGITGKYSNHRIPVIYGLDPAGPLFYHQKPPHRIDKSDANHVQIIHTSDNFGLSEPVGTSNFYPNFGYSQPGCIFKMDLSVGCSHNRAWKFFAESINSHTFFASQCSSYNKLITFFVCDLEGKGAYMGGDSLGIDEIKSGIFYLVTNADPPYGRWTEKKNERRHLVKFSRSATGNH